MSADALMYSTQRNPVTCTRHSSHVFQDIALLLLEAGANIDLKNSAKQTPIFLAIEANHKSLCHVSFLCICTCIFVVSFLMFLS